MNENPHPNTTHGKQGTRLYRTWIDIKRRCYSEYHQHYADYGGKGIHMDKTWKKDFQAFFNHFGRDLEPGERVARIDTKKGYYQGNLEYRQFRGQRA